MAAVAALGDPEKMRILLRQIFDDLPGIVPAPVVDKEHTAVFTDLSGSSKTLQLVQEQRRRHRENRLFVVARDYDIEDGCHAHTPPFSSVPKR